MQHLDRDGLTVAEAEAQVLDRHVQTLREVAAQAAEDVREARQAVGLAVAQWQSYQEEQRRFEETRLQLAGSETRARQLGELRTTLEHELNVAQHALHMAEAAQPKDLDAKKLAWQVAKAESQRLETALSPLSETQADHAEALERVKLALARRETAADLAREDLTGFPPGIAKVEGSARACRDRLSVVETSLETLGPVNHRAAREVQVKRTNLDTLRNQLDEARQAVAELTDILATIDAETSARLATATGALRRHFKHYVAELFGAEATADVETLLEAGRPVGITIALQPPGKQTRALNLLSVGERTMGALAFLFSLMQGDDAQRLPLAVLDEVDAPLDEANIRRFARFSSSSPSKVRSSSSSLTKRRRFEIADVLWGVTSDQGVSRLFSIAKADYVTVG